MTSKNPEATFRRRAVDLMQGFSESTNLRLDAQEKATAANTEAVNELTKAITAQTQNIARLERGITQMVAESVAQRESIDRMIEQQAKFLELATMQAQIIREQRAS